MKTVTALLAIFLGFAAFADGTTPPTDAQRASWTMSDMLAVRTALDAWSIDHKRTFPAGKTLDELRTALEPVYIRTLPMSDAWGHAYRYESDGKSYRLVSAGSDGVFAADTWTVPGKAGSYADDAVGNEAGQWLFRYWSER